MQVKIEPLAPDLEAAIRQKLAANPFIKFVGIQVPQLGQGYARFLLPFKPDLANSIGLMQGASSPPWRMRPWLTPSTAWCPRARPSTRWR